MGTTLSNFVESSPDATYLRFECEKGSIVYTGGSTTLYLRGYDGLDDDKIETISLDEDGFAAEESSSLDNKKVSGQGHCILVSDLITAILEDREPYITGESARKGVDVVLAIYESSRTGKKVML